MEEDFWISHPVYLFITAFIVLLVLLVFFFSLIKIIKRSIPFDLLFEAFSIILGFCFLGMTIGLFIGLSKTPVVGLVIPALLTFIAGLISYFFLTQRDSISVQNRIFSGLSLATLCISLVIGMHYGVLRRTQDQYFQDFENLKTKEFEHLLKIDIEMFKNHPEKYHNDSSYYHKIFKELKYKSDLNINDLPVMNIDTIGVYKK